MAFAGLRPCEQHVGGHGLAHGAIPVRDDVGNHFSHTSFTRASHMGFHWSLFRFVSGRRTGARPGSNRRLTPRPRPTHLHPSQSLLFPQGNGVANRLACPDPARTLDVKLNKLDLHRIASFVKVASPPIIPTKLPCPFPKPKSIQYATSHNYARGEANET